MVNSRSKSGRLKILFPVIILLIISSCTPTKSKLESELIDNWGIYVRTSNDSSSYYCNSCPKIDFMENQKAVLTLTTGKKEHYKWELIETRLTMNIRKKDTGSHYFEEPEYNIEITTKEDFKELKLSDTAGYYTLRK